jgi:hypothetical protein
VVDGPAAVRLFRPNRDLSLRHDGR